MRGRIYYLLLFLSLFQQVPEATKSQKMGVFLVVITPLGMKFLLKNCQNNHLNLYLLSGTEDRTIFVFDTSSNLQMKGKKLF